jgi:thiol-disulfide isomerase/thioredoxin
MDPVAVLAVLALLVAATTAVGFVWQSQQGRIRHASGTTLIRVADIPGVRRFATGATFVQFSTEVCAPCAATRTVLDAIASEHDDVAHVDIDLTHRPDLATQFRIMQTPTTLILDGKGVVRARIGGAPRREAVRAELDRILVAA